MNRALQGFLLTALWATGMMAGILVSPRPGGKAQAAVTHQVTFTISGAGAATLYKSSSACTGANFTQLASITTGSYIDTNVIAGSTVCYWLFIPANNGPAGPYEAVVPTNGSVTVKLSSNNVTVLPQ